MSLEKRNPQDTKPISPAKEQNAKQIKARKSAQLLQLNKILLKIAELSEQKIINREAELISILEEYFSFLKLLSTRRMTDTLSILEKSSIETLIEVCIGFISSPILDISMTAVKCAAASLS